ncbi:MAG: putative manganese transporter [Bacilli bacterium]
MKEVITETLIDSFKLLPFLFITFLIIELFEHKLSKKSKNAITNSGKLGPLIGSFLGLIPQCGFSVAVTNLYATRIITFGTLISIYLSTSDEMIPILIAEQAPIELLIKIIILKFIIGFIFGFIIDLLFKKRENENYSLCKEEHCHCDKKIFRASLKHTLNIFIFIVICNFIINFIMEFGGMNYLKDILLKDNILGSFITSLIGLIPNCGASVVLTELFLNNAISFSALVAGLLSGAGIALLVLFKTNKNKKENFMILGLLYLIGAISGVILEIILKII